MCGIIGYTGKKQAKDVLLDALELLEYRGYDSAGIALSSHDTPDVQVLKCAGRVKDLRKRCEGEGREETCGIGHTRWATHGGVCDENAHPHQFGKVTIVHNGIIENYKELTEHYHLSSLLKSQTDTEVAAAMLDHYYQGDPYAAIRKTVLKLKGTFALVILFADRPGTIYAVRNVSPIVAARCDDGCILASDVTALCQFTDRYFVVPEFHVLEMNADGLKLYDLSGDEAQPEYMTVDWDVSRADKGGYPFYMEKEIMEQPDAIRRTIEGRIVDGLPDFSVDQVPDTLLTECERVCVVACGTAMHAGLVAQSLMQSILRMHVDVEYASEFMYADPVIDEKTLVIAISQSGETIDTLEALKYARKQGARSLSIINVRGASIARESEYVLYTMAGPEIAVASTKAYTTQLAVLYLLVGRMAYLRGVMSREETVAFMEEIKRVPEVMEDVLTRRQDIHRFARTILNAKDAFMIGRGLDYSILLEGSLKLKEISYIHTEAYASGELKHGTIALITENTPVIAVVTQRRLHDKEMSNIREVKSRGAAVTLFIKQDYYAQAGEQDWSGIFTLPDMPDVFMVFPASVALQLLAYYVSMDKGLDVDKPRNLAKVVTVE